MSKITEAYTLKYELSFAPKYKWTECGKCFNVKTGRKLKQSYVSGSLGYSINGKFKSLTFLRKHLVKITESDCPF